MTNSVMPVNSASSKFSLSISQFPQSLHATLAEIDDEGNGLLEMDELTEVFTMYADMKKAAKSDSIALSTLPKELRPTLKPKQLCSITTTVKLCSTTTLKLF